MIVKNKPGQMVVEVLLALAISALALVGLVHLSTRSVSNSSLSSKQSQATGLANQAMELVVSEKNRLGWESMQSTYTGNRCYDGSVIGASAACVASGTNFNSAMTFTYQNVTPAPTGAAVSQLTVTIEISWTEGSRTARIRQSRIFTRY